jgi:hypothetical protein
MNKYVLRTSLVWIIILAAIAGIWAYRTHAIKQPTAMKTPMSGEMQPVASGPPATADEPKPSMPDMKMDAPLVPVQLTPERMQSIGVQTGTVEYKQLSDDIRATGTVDINERLLSYVQVRFPGYIRKVFANATYQYVQKRRTTLHHLQPGPRRNSAGVSAGTAEPEDHERQHCRWCCGSGAATSFAAAEQRLQQWDIPESEIAKLKETGKPVTDLTINSPVEGYITERNALPNMYAEPSTKLYTVADLSRVWVYAQVFQDDIGR